MYLKYPYTMDERERGKLFTHVASLLKGYGAEKVAVFGSYARGDDHASSDLDALVTFSERKSLIDFARIEREVSEAVGVSVDLVTEKSLSPYLADRIKKEMKVVSA